MLAGLTGGIGSGKSTAASYFAELNITVIDADQIARDVVKPDSSALADIIKYFGLAILDNNSQLNRKKLSALIFNNNAAREWLENLLHPLIIAELQKQAKSATSPYCILVIPLLLEKNLQTIVDRVLVVDAPEELQQQRALQRDKISKEQLIAIIKTQLPREQRLAKADDVLYNNGDLKNLRQQVINLHKKYLKLAGE